MRPAGVRLCPLSRYLFVAGVCGLMLYLWYSRLESGSNSSASSSSFKDCSGTLSFRRGSESKPQRAKATEKAMAGVIPSGSINLLEYHQGKEGVKPIDFSQFDAVIIPGIGGPKDGLKPTQTLPEWVTAKLDGFMALDRASGTQHRTPVVLLSAGTAHRAGPLDQNGRNSQESTSMALYLEEKGFNVKRLYEENCAYDTIGNAYYLRSIHTDPRDWKRLLIVMNEFHLPRLKLIFDWVFQLPSAATAFGQAQYDFSFAYWPDDQLKDQEVIQARRKREAESFATMETKIRTLALKSFAEMHEFVHQGHDLYASSNRRKLILEPRVTVIGDVNALKSYG